MTEQEELKHVFKKVGVGSGPEPLAHMAAFGEYLCHIQRVFDTVVIVHIRRNRIAGYENDVTVYTGQHYTVSVVTADANVTVADVSRVFNRVLSGVLSGDTPISGDAVRELYKLIKVDYNYSKKLLDLLEIGIRAEVKLDDVTYPMLVKAHAEATAIIKASNPTIPIDDYVAKLALASWDYVDKYYLV